MDQCDGTRPAQAEVRFGAQFLPLATPLRAALPLVLLIRPALIGPILVRPAPIRLTLVRSALIGLALVRERLCLVHIRVLAAARRE